jgi:capsular exopolysaccharide synthesis family protein
MKQLLPENSSDNNGLPILRPEYAGMEPAGGELPPAPPSFKLQKFFAFLLKYWWIPVITLLLGIGGGYAYVRTMPHSYVSYALLVKPVAVQVNQGIFIDDPNFLGTQTELLQSDTLRDRTLAHLREMTNNIPLDANGQPMYVDISVSASAKSSVYTVIGTSANPAYVQAYVDTLVLEYLAYRSDARKLASSQSLEAITDAELKYEKELRDKQDILAEYNRTNNIFLVRQQAQSDALYLANQEIKLADEQMELQLLKREANDKLQNHFVTNATGISTGTNANAPVAASSAPESLSLEKQLDILKYEKKKLSVNLRPKHPKIAALDAEIEKTEKILSVADQQTEQTIATAIENLERTIDETSKAIEKMRATLEHESDLISGSDSKQSDVQQILRIYEKLQGIEQTVQLGRTIEQDPLTKLQAAVPASRTYKAEETMMTKCSVGGLFTGLAIVFLIALRNDEFASSNDVNERFGEVIVGQVPDVRGVRKKKPLALLQDNDDRHSYAESYRNLRSALFYLANDGSRPKLVLVTSAIPNEGKSTIAANLAKIMAVGGAKVLLVDGDMRRGALHAQFGLRQEPGFTDLLRQPGDLATIIQETSVPNLKFIGRGGNVMNPGDLLLGAQLDQVLKEFREGFDYVVIDSCPVFAADDVTTLAPKLDGALFVVRSQFSRAKVVQEALDLLYQRQARVLGLVFNRARSSSRKDHYYNYSQYHSHKAA